MTSRHFAIVGDPVSHSKSPEMHAAAYAATGLDCTYDAIRVTDTGLASIVGLLRAGELDGVNVTIPHKQRILAHVDLVDPSARKVGAANTLVRDPQGRIVAHNTDVPGLAEELSSLAPEVSRGDWAKAEALVLGTGATARAAILALACHLEVGRITVRGRAFEGMARRDGFFAEVRELLVRAGAASALRLEPWGPNVDTEREVVAIVQATSLGMEGAGPGEVAALAVAWPSVRPSSVALDVVYTKRTTAFVTDARRQGLRSSDGRGLLARQGALAFELWLGRPAPTLAMHAALASL